MLLCGGHNLGGNLPPLDTLYLKKCGCSDARYSAYQLSAHVTLLLLPPRSSFALQSSKEKVGRERRAPCFLSVFSTSCTLERFYRVPSVNSAVLIMHGFLLTLIPSSSSRLPSWVQRKFLLVCLFICIGVFWFVLPEPKEFLFFCPNINKLFILNYF